MPRSRIQNVLRQFLQPKRMGIVAIAFGFVIAMLLTRPASAAVAYRGVGTGSNASATTVALNKPTGTVLNDVMIAVVSVRGGTAVTGITSPGWTQINTTTSGTSLRSAAFYKVATSSEAASYTFTFAPATAQKASGVIVAYSGVDTADPVNISGIQANASSATMTAPSVTTTVANTMLVALYSAAVGGTVTVGSSMTLRGQASATGSPASGQSTAAIQDATQAAATTTTTKTATISTAAVSIGHLIALRPMPIVSQANYRFFQNTDSTTASTPYAAAGTSAAIAKSTPFRLRLSLGVASGSTTMTNTAARTFTLQYALRGTDNVCDTSFTGETYANVTSSSVVQFYNNITPADGAAYVTSANDPTRTGITAIAQKYHEINPISVGTNVLGNQDALWDIALTTSGVNDGETYCLRVLDSNNTQPLSGGYGIMPQFTIPTPTVAQANYRWMANSDSTVPGSPLANQDTAASIGANTPFRLRQRLAVDAAALPVSAGLYKLQYAQKSGTCDVAFTGEAYTDMKGGSVTKMGSSAVESTASGNVSWSAGVTTLNYTDGVYTGVSSSGGNQSTYSALLTGYGFSVPANATITGISIAIPYSASVVSPSYGASLGFNVILGGNSISPSSGKNYTNFTGGGTEVFGGDGNNLGISSLSPAIVNDPTFGLSVSAGAAWDPYTLDDSSVSLDSASITVYYTLPLVLGYYNNPVTGSGGSVSSNINDPTNGARPAVYQTYNEDDPYSNGISAISAGSDGLWDFALTSGPTAGGKTYCIRVVKSSGALLDTYMQIPEISVISTGPTLDQQLRGGQSLINGSKGSLSW